MNPADFYRLKSAEIKEADIRLVAACMSEHVGEENAVRLEKLAARVGFGERQVRDMLETLVVEYGWPIGAHAGIAGRWIIANEEERWRVLGDLDSRQKALYTRRNALLTAKVPNALELNKQAALTMQTGLFGG